VTTATFRPVRARLYISWLRAVDVNAYATVGTSIIGGTDIIQGVGDVAINESDAYYYYDETVRVLRLEYERHLIEPLGGTAIAMADVVLDNTDLKFTPNYNSTIGTAIEPNRPMKMFIGFEVQGQETLIPIIEALTLQPEENKSNRTVKLTAYDFMKALNEKPQETTIYVDQRSDEIIADILARAGVGSLNYQLDPGLNTIGFAWFEKGQTAGERIRKICEAEEAIFFQDEQGVLHFENRDKYSESPYNASVWTIEPDDIIEWQQEQSSEIINRAIVKGAPRSVKAEVEVWRDGVEEEVNGSGGQLIIWADFDDPVSSLTSPVSATDYEAHVGTGGTETNITSDVSITMDGFTKAAKLTITNNNASKAYINLLKLRGTPATVDYEIKEVYQDDDSIDKYNEYQREIENEFIDKKNFARNMAQDIVRRHKDPMNILRLTIRGIPQLQLRDWVRVKDQDLNTYFNYRVIGIQGRYEPGSFTQTLELRLIASNEVL
jgi:hypothetical protein